MANEYLKLLLKAPKLLLRGDKDKLFGQIQKLLKPVPKDYSRKFKMRLNQWLLNHQKNIVFDKCHWMGVKAFKNPFDSWIYQEIIYGVKPDIIVEIGSAHGGSTLYLANLLDIIGKGQVISIDIDRTNYNVKHDRIIEVTGDSSAPETFEKVSRLCQGKATLIFHDGEHSKEHVLKDLNAYSRLVSKGSYFIVEDGIVDLFKPGDGIGTYVEGPLAAVEIFMENNPDFIVDAERERYILTYNPKGFLKRVR
jgi:cephalosporin hydroxylase